MIMVIIIIEKKTIRVSSKYLDKTNDDYFQINRNEWIDWIRAE